jgi:hypothetical protein
MCMACDSGKTSTKKKIIIFSSMGIVIAIATYFVFTTTNNPAIAATLPALISFTVCPLMCAAVGGLMWFSRRSSKSNDNHEDSHNKPITTNTKEEASCCSKEILQRINKNQNEGLELTRIAEEPNNRISKSNEVGSFTEQKPRNKV